ncbi:exosporium leader peptide-containing protein, partial [Bacillus wiedmannii]|uniref:exosporium leader peptide-containing protein n=1 Tax=Bacillus wiedmannii TaxID=1890302 RepID=UPI0030001DB0
MDEFLSSTSINPDLLGPTLPAIPPFTLPTGPTGPTGGTGPTGDTGPGCIEPLPIFTQIVYVNKAGNDATADGSECAPFLT